MIWFEKGLMEPVLVLARLWSPHQQCSFYRPRLAV